MVRVAGVATPLVVKLYQRKVVILPFRVCVSVLHLFLKLLNRMMVKSIHERLCTTPLSKISRFAYVLSRRDLPLNVADVKVNLFSLGI